MSECCRVWDLQRLSSVTLASSLSGEELCCWLDSTVKYKQFEGCCGVWNLRGERMYLTVHVYCSMTMG